MTVYAIDSTGKSKTVYRFADKESAQKVGNSYLLVESADDLAGASVSLRTLSSLHNAIVPAEQKVNKFADINTGANTVFPLLEGAAVEYGDEPPAGTTDATTANDTNTTKDTENLAVSADKGSMSTRIANRNPKLAGAKLFPGAAAQEKNPQREGSIRAKSLEIIRNKPGLTFEEYVKAGGDRGALLYMRQREAVRVEISEQAQNTDTAKAVEPGAAAE